ncbi:MAG: PAS domain S-box protein [Methanoregula sp.]
MRDPYRRRLAIKLGRTFDNRGISLLIVLSLLIGLLWIVPVAAQQSQVPVNGPSPAMPANLTAPGSVTFTHMPDPGAPVTGPAVQDRQGFMWFPTEAGLVKYGPYGPVKIFTTKNSAIANNWVTEVYLDRTGQLWMGTVSGISRLDPQTEEFVTYHKDPANPDTLSGEKLVMLHYHQGILEDRAGFIWFATDNGLNRFNPVTGKFTSYLHTPGDPASISGNEISSVYEDRAGNLWVGTIGAGLERFNRTTGTFTHYRHDPGNPASISADTIYTIHEDPEGILWIGTQDGGLNRFDPDTNVFRPYKRPPLSGSDKINAADSRYPLYNTVDHIFEAGPGRLLVAYGYTSGNGLSVFDEESGTFTHYLPSKDDTGSPYAGTGMGFSRSTDGTIWISYLTGIDTIQPGSSRFRMYPGLARAQLTEDPEGNVWGASFSGGGIYKFDRQHDTVTHYTTADGLKTNETSSILVDSDGDLWVIEGTALTRFDRHTFQRRESYELGASKAIGFLEDNHAPGVLWVNLYGYGPVRFDKHTHEIVSFKANPANPQALESPLINCLYQDPDGNIWMSLMQKGSVTKYDHANGTFVRYTHNPHDPDSLSNETVTTVGGDTRGRVYMGTTDGGLNQYDPATGKFRRFTFDKIGFIPDGPILGYKDEIYIGTFDQVGLVRFNPDTGMYKLYTGEDGLMGMSYPAYKGMTRDGEIWVSGSLGTSHFFPDKLTENTVPPQVYLTALTQGGQPFILNQTVSTTPEISLDWQHNYFEFEFVALNYLKAEKNRYQYMLEGLDKDWYNAGTERKGRYSGLPAGTYTLRIKGSNNDGVWNEQGVFLKTTIVPPFWETWWFRGIALLALAALVFAAYHIRIRSMQERARELEREVSERRKTEQELRESERKFRAIFDQTFQFIGLLKPDGTVIEANRSALKFSRIKESDIIGKPFWDTPWWTHSTDLQEKLRVEIIKAAKGEFVRFEATHFAADGNLHYIDFSIKPVMDESGAVLLLIPEGRDITERKRAEDAMKVSEQRLADLISFLPDATFAIDRQGKIIAWNRAIEEMTGVPAGDIMGKSDHEYGIPFYGERRPILIDLVFKDDDGIRSRYPFVDRKEDKFISEIFIQRLYGGKGAQLWCIASPLYDTVGNITGAIESIRDVTDRKKAEEALSESEQKYRTILENIQDVFYRTDREGTMIMISPSGAALLAYDSPDEMMGISIAGQMYAHPGDRVAFLEAMKEKGYVRNYEVNLKRKDGTVVMVSTNSHYYYDTDGGIAGIEGIFQDITERKKAEDALRLSEQRLMDIFNFLPDATFAIDREGKVIAWNRAIEEMTGVSAEEILGKCDHEYGIPFYGEKRPILIDLVFKDDDEIKSKYPYVERDEDKFISEIYIQRLYSGKGAHLWFIASPLYDTEGNIIGAIESIRNITDRKKAEEALSESEQKYRTLVESSFDGIVIHQKGLIVYVNTAAIHLFGGTSEKRSIGVPVLDFVHPDYRAKVRERITAAVKDNQRILREKFVRRDGSVIDADVVSIPIVWNGEPAGYVIFRDVTDTVKAEMALRLSERRLMDIINFLPDATFAIDREGKVIAWNRAIEEMTGVSAEKILGKNDHEYGIPFYGEKRPILIDLVFKDDDEIRSKYPYVEKKDDRFISEIYIQRLYGGKGAHLWFIASPLYDTEGNIIGAIESIRDVTDRRMAQDALDRATKKLSLLNSITFSDIQNGIYSLTGYLQLQDKIQMDEKMRRFHDRQVGIVQTITESLKFANHYQGLGLKAPSWQKVQHSFLLGISHTDISRMARTLNVEGLEIYADPLLENVFFTLAENVLLHGETATEITFRYHESPEGLTLFFEDNGVGIPDSMKERVFERQYEEKKGMGLFLAREILSITGITIRETGEPGKGARFEIAVQKGGYRFA